MSDPFLPPELVDALAGELDQDASCDDERVSRVGRCGEEVILEGGADKSRSDSRVDVVYRVMGRRYCARCEEDVRDFHPWAGHRRDNRLVEAPVIAPRPSSKLARSPS